MKILIKYEIRWYCVMCGYKFIQVPENDNPIRCPNCGRSEDEEEIIEDEAGRQ